MNSWFLYQLLLFCLPLPFGLNREWAWSIAGITIISLLFWQILKLNNKKKLQQTNNPILPVTFIKSKYILASLIAVQLIVFLQYIFSSLGKYDTFLYLIKGCIYTSFFALTLLIVDSRQRVYRIIWIVIIAASFQAIYGAIMVLTGWEYSFFTSKQDYLGLATGTFINRNHLAGYLVMSLALGIGLLLAQAKSSKAQNWNQRLRELVQWVLSTKMLLRLLLIIMVAALVLTRSRMGNTAFFASLSILGLVALILMRNKSTSTVILLSSLLIIDIAIVGTFFGIEKVAERIQSTSVDTESRDEVARDTFNIWKQYPITGTGAGTFVFIYPAFKAEDVTSAFINNNAHNDYVQFLAEFGLPAFCLLLGITLTCFWHAISAMRQRNNSFFQGVGFGAAMGMLAIGIHSSVDFNLQIPANAMMFILLMCLALIARWAPYKTPPGLIQRA